MSMSKKMKKSPSPSQDSKSTAIADTAITDPLAFTAPIVADKLEPASSTQRLHGRHDYADGMSSTNRVTSLLEYSQPFIVLPTFTGTHAFKVDLLDALVDWWILGRLVCLFERDG